MLPEAHSSPEIVLKGGLHPHKGLTLSQLRQHIGGADPEACGDGLHIPGYGQEQTFHGALPDPGQALFAVAAAAGSEMTASEDLGGGLQVLLCQGPQLLLQDPVLKDQDPPL